MKLTKLFAIAALIGVGIFTTAVILGTHAIDSFALATVALVLVGFVRDYTPRRTAWEPRKRSGAYTGRRPSAMKLAA